MISSTLAGCGTRVSRGVASSSQKARSTSISAPPLRDEAAASITADYLEPQRPQCICLCGCGKPIPPDRLPPNRLGGHDAYFASNRCRWRARKRRQRRGAKDPDHIRARTNVKSAEALGAPLGGLLKAEASNEVAQLRQDRRTKRDVSAAIQAELLSQEIRQAFEEDEHRPIKRRSRGSGGNRRRSAELKAKVAKFDALHRYR